jgi:hypothetical protein
MKQTTRSLVTMLALLAAAAGIGGAALWVNKSSEKETKQKEKSAKLFDFEPAKARSVKLSREGKLIALATRSDEKASWKIAEPIQTDGDAAAVDAIVTGVADLKQKSDLGEADGKQYGLEAPPIVVAVKTDDGKEQVLEVGDTNPFDGTLYVRKAGEKVVRIADGFSKSAFEKQLFDLRDKRVAHLEESAEIRRIEVAGVPLPYTLEKDGTAWKLLAPIPGAADASTADRIASSIRSLRATSVAAESTGAAGLKQWGLTPAKLTVQLTVSAPGGKDTFRRAVAIGQPAPAKGSVAVKTYAKRDDSGAIYEVDGQILKDMQKELFDLQDKLLVHASREDVRKLVFEQPRTPKIVVERKKEQAKDAGVADESFSVLEPKQGPAKKWKVSSALYSIAGLRAAKFGGTIGKTTEPMYGLTRSITLLGDGDKVLSRIRIGSETKDGKRRYVASDGEPRIAEVEKGVLDELPKTLEDVLEPPPAAAAATDAGTPLQASKPAK